MEHLPGVHTTPLHRVGVEGVRGKGGWCLFSLHWDKMSSRLKILSSLLMFRCDEVLMRVSVTFPALRRQEDQEFKTSLSYRPRPRPTWATWDCLKKPEKKREERGAKEGWERLRLGRLILKLDLGERKANMGHQEFETLILKWKKKIHSAINYDTCAEEFWGKGLFFLNLVCLFEGQPATCSLKWP